MQEIQRKQRTGRSRTRTGEVRVEVSPTQQKRGVEWHKDHRWLQAKQRWRSWWQRGMKRFFNRFDGVTLAQPPASLFCSRAVATHFTLSPSCLLFLLHLCLKTSLTPPLQTPWLTGPYRETLTPLPAPLLVTFTFSFAVDQGRRKLWAPYAIHQDCTKDAASQRP